MNKGLDAIRLGLNIGQKPDWLFIRQELRQSITLFNTLIVSSFGWRLLKNIDRIKEAKQKKPHKKV
jgi:hypothetical protein